MLGNEGDLAKPLGFYDHQLSVVDEDGVQM